MTNIFYWIVTIKWDTPLPKVSSFFFSHRVELPVIELRRDKRTKYARSGGQGSQKQKKEND
jgi:hypothetical protein